MIEKAGLDAVVVTTSDAFHERYVLAAVQAGKYVFCEKPLAPSAESCKRIVDAELAAGKQLVQVGFMRRYDPGYRQLKEAIQSRRYGEPLLLHCAHRNASITEPWDNASAVENSMVHEIDVLRWLLGEDYATAEVRFGKSTRRAKEDSTTSDYGPDYQVRGFVLMWSPLSATAIATISAARWSARTAS